MGSKKDKRGNIFENYICRRKILHLQYTFDNECVKLFNKNGCII